MSEPVKTFTVARRRHGVSHDEVVAAWSSPHAAGVVQHMAPDAYVLSFFEPRDGRAPFDGMAALTYLDPARAAANTGRNIPAVVAHDGWSDLVELPTTWLRVVEHVIVPGPGPGHAPADEREAACKLTFFVSARPGIDTGRIHRHWLEIHAPNVASSFVASGGVRYVVNLVERSSGGDFVGVAELSYQDRDAARGHRIEEDGFNPMTTGIVLPGREVVVVAGY